MQKKIPLGTIQHSRTDAQREHMERTVGEGTCPFCVLDPDLNQVIAERKHWRMWPNPFPYKHHAHHLVLAAKKHIVHPQELPREAWMELGDHLLWATTQFDIPGGGLVMRFGDLAYNAGTLQHLHAHIQVPDLTGPAKATFAKAPSPIA